jgi:hypothetical protein
MAMSMWDDSLNVWAFADWLVAHSHDGLVGRARDTEYCPLACWLADLFGGQWSVGPAGYVGLDDVEQGGKLPAWAAQFYRAIDSQCCGLVTAAAAYGVLLTLVPELRDAWRW